MKLDELTIGEAKQLAAMFGAVQSAPASDDPNDVRIVILQRGWVMVGRYSRAGTQCHLRDAAVVRVWGTTRGLGEIASGGPTSTTKLDPVPPVEFHELTVVAAIRCNPEKWGVLSAR